MVTAADKFEGPCPRAKPGFKLELASEAGANGTDAFDRLVALPFVRNQGCLETANGNGRFVDDLNHDHDDVFIVIIDLH